MNFMVFISWPRTGTNSYNCSTSVGNPARRQQGRDA
jgi:hypothetical protein